MTFQQEFVVYPRIYCTTTTLLTLVIERFNSWFSPGSSHHIAASSPTIGDEAPQTGKLLLTPGRSNPTIIAFLRHCGCPFAEKTFLDLRDVAKREKDIDFIAVSHSDEQSTDAWLASLPQHGSETSNLRVVVDHELEAYSAYGLGPSPWTHILHPMQFYNVFRIGREQGIWNRPTQSGSRWQTAGSFAIDASGTVRWGGAAERGDNIPNFNAAVASVKTEPKL